MRKSEVNLLVFKAADIHLLSSASPPPSGDSANTVLVTIEIITNMIDRTD